MQFHEVQKICKCSNCSFDQLNQGKHDVMLLGKTLLNLLITPETIRDYNYLYQQIYKTPEKQHTLTSNNLSEHRSDKLLVRIIRQKQIINDAIPEAFISIGRIPEPYVRHKCFRILRDSNGHEIINFSMKDHILVLIYEMSRWIKSDCFHLYPHIAFVNIIQLISNINVYCVSDEQHSDWLYQLNKISFVSKTQLSLTESSQIVMHIYSNICKMAISYGILSQNNFVSNYNGT